MKIKVILLAAASVAASILPKANAQRLTQYNTRSTANTQMSRANPGQNPDVPIDGGISLLIAAGAGLGIKKLRKRKTGL